MPYTVRKLRTTQLRVSTMSDNVIAVSAQQRCIRSRSGSAVGHVSITVSFFLSFRLYITNILIINSLNSFSGNGHSDIEMWTSTAYICFTTYTTSR